MNNTIKNRIVATIAVIVVLCHIILCRSLIQIPKEMYWAICYQLEHNSDTSFHGKMNSVVKGIQNYSTINQPISENNVNLWIDVYGLMVKMLGLYKPDPNCPAVKLINNQLSFYECKDVDIDDYATALIDFKKYLEKKNIEFVYVQAPHKCYKYQPNLPPGITDYNIQIFDRFIQSIEDSVSVIDMREYFKLNPEKHYQLFYPGDAHWRPEYAFITSQQIMMRLQNNCSCIIDPKVNNLNNYKLEITDKKCNEISQRLGNYYYSSNMEFLQYLVPKFDTFMSIYSEPVKTIYNDTNNYLGPYKPSLLSQVRTKMCVKNTNAINAKKVLFLGDSFSPPVMSFLSLCFTDIEYHALNFYDDDIFDEIEKFNPDIVIMLLTARIVGNDNSDRPTPNTKRYFEMIVPPKEKESCQVL